MALVMAAAEKETATELDTPMECVPVNNEEREINLEYLKPVRTSSWNAVLFCVPPVVPVCVRTSAYLTHRILTPQPLLARAPFVRSPCATTCLPCTLPCLVALRTHRPSLPVPFRRFPR